MDNFQIQTQSGLVIGIFSAVSSYDAVRKYAREKGFKSYEEMSAYLGLFPDYEVRDFRIILSVRGERKIQ